MSCIIKCVVAFRCPYQKYSTRQQFDSFSYATVEKIKKKVSRFSNCLPATKCLIGFVCHDPGLCKEYKLILLCISSPLN